MAMDSVTAVEQEHFIPGLDLGPYLRGEKGALDPLAAALRETCEKVGFFYIENHGIRQVLIDRTFAASKAIALPEIRDRMIAGGQEPLASTPEEFEIKLKSDVAKFARIIKEAKIPLQD